MKFKVVGKSLILTDYSHKITEGENSFDTVEIAVPKSHDNCDLSTLSFRFSEVLENGENSAVQILHHSKCDEKYIYLKGKITSDFSAITGNVTFMLTGINGENVVAKFQSDIFTVSDDISLKSLPNETTAEQIYNQTHLEAVRAAEAADRAEKFSKTPAPAEIYPATTKRLGGVIVDGKSIIASEDGTISTADNEDMKAEIAELKAVIGFTDKDIIGLHADFENNVFTRLGAAAGKNAGTDFDAFPMYGGRRRCNVLDDGTITAYYGDNNFAEDGSNGQVMVYQPKFYYKVVPLKLDPQDSGYGYNLRSANYYISSVPKCGFKLHPAFYNEDDEPTNYILLSAYEGSIFDASENTYLQSDEQTADFSNDKLSSIADVKPCSGSSQKLTRSNAELLAKNRGAGWHISTIKSESANQILAVIELAAFDTQNFVGQGVVSISDISRTNCAINTGKSSTMGNSTGSTNGESGKTSISYRGIENPWGNLWRLVNGINSYTDSNKKTHGYICSNFDFEENKNNENYTNIGFVIESQNGYISAFGYSELCDWGFIASQTEINSSIQIGDYHWGSSLLSKWSTCYAGGNWYEKAKSGLFNLGFDSAYNYSNRIVGARLIYVPGSKIN